MCAFQNSILLPPVFSSPEHFFEHKVLRVSFCDSPLSVVRQCVNFFIRTTSSLKPLIGFWLNFTGMISGWSLTKVVQTVPVGCLSRSQGIFFSKFSKFFLAVSTRPRAFIFWYIAPSRGPLPKLFKLCPWGQNWPRSGGHNFTLNYIMKTSNDFFFWTANGNLTTLDRNGPWLVPYQNCSNGSDWLHK